MAKFVMFDTEKEAREHFAEAMEEWGSDPEQCEACGLWSLSAADAEDGGIVSCGDDFGYDRICLGCDEEDL